MADLGLAARIKSTLPLDRELLAVYEKALRLGAVMERPRTPPISFTGVLMAVLRGEDSLSKWFAEEATKGAKGPSLELMLLHKQTTAERIDKALAAPAPSEVWEREPLLTVSSKSVLENACSWAQKVGALEIGVRHVLAAYLISPPANHRADLARWQVSERDWEPVFFDHVAPIFTSEKWIEAKGGVAPAAHVYAVPSADTLKFADLAWPGDGPAKRVLRNAQLAHLHSRHPGDVKSVMLLFALIDCAELDDKLKAEISPLWHEVEKQRDRFNAARDSAGLKDFDADPDDEAVDGNLALSPQMVNLLETARLLARSPARPAEKVGVFDLVGAFASRRVAAEDELVECGIDPAALRAAVVDKLEAWREALSPETVHVVARPVQLDSDEPFAVIDADPKWESDPLQRKRDVEPFAALLAARKLSPPLSLGLFGPWGSGKTTFMRRLRTCVEERTKLKQPEYVENAVHVEFNAWHYAESDLVSSLLAAVFRAVDDNIKGFDEKDRLTWLQRRQQQLASAQRAAAAAEAVRRKAVADEEAAKKALQDAMADARKKQEAVAIAAGKAAKDAWATARKQLEDDPELSGALKALDTASTSVSALREQIAAMRRPGRLLASVGLGTWLLAIGVMVAMPIGATVLVEKVLDSDALAKGLTTLTSLLGVVALGARKLGTVAASVDRTAALVETEVAAKVDQAVTTEREALERAQAVVKVAEAKVAETAAEVVRAESAAAEARLPALVADLVGRRVADGTYTKSLGLASTARADLQELASLLRAQTTTTAPSSPENSPPPRQVDRVILYIDDLDRCEPAQVVKVLQLVHMLLAFELFVVVVGVDARWVRHALQRHLDTIAKGDEHRPTPEEYLEKIFQVAFWLEPMDPMRTAAYVGSLISRPGAPVPAEWEVGAYELDFLSALSSQIATTPRRTKRLINVYRLIKARLGEEQLKTFLVRPKNQAPGPYQIALALLVIGVSNGALGPALLVDLAQTTDTKLEAVIKRYREKAEHSMAADVLATLGATQPGMPFVELRGWALLVGRYLLHQAA